MTRQLAANRSQAAVMGDTAVEVTLSIRAEHAEGPLWDAATARLWWVDITGQRVHCFDPATGNHSSWATAGQPGGVVLDAAGEPVVASPEGLAVLDRSTGTMDLRVPIERDRPENRANDVKTDSRGRAWVGTMAYDKRPRNAALYRIEGAKTTRVADGLTICNGPAFDEHAGPPLPRRHRHQFIVDLFDLDPATGTLTGRRRFLDFCEAQVWPDGMTVDERACCGSRWAAPGPFTATAPKAPSTASSSYPPPTPPRWPSAAPTAATCTSPPHGSTSTRTAAPPSPWPA